MGETAPGSILLTKTDVLIIGGGIVGLSIAYFLLRKEKTSEGVTLLEKENRFVSHASSHNAGGISSAHLSQTPEMRKLAKKTRDLHLELSKTNGFDFDFRVNGLIELLGEDELELKRSNLREKLQKFNDEGLARVELLASAEEIKNKEPNLSMEKGYAALHYPDDAQGNSLKLGHCFSKICSDSGMRLETETIVKSFETRDHEVERVSTNRGEILPKVLVIAAGPWSGEIASKLNLSIPISPIKGHLITTRKSENRILNSFVSGPSYYVMQDSEGALVVGGGEDPVVGYDSSVIGARAKEAWDEMSILVPKLVSLGQQDVSACLRPFSSDGVPIIGRSSRYKNLFFATGHFRNGFSLAPVTGRIISDLIIQGRTDLEISNFSPARFGA